MLIFDREKDGDRKWCGVLYKGWVSLFILYEVEMQKLFCTIVVLVMAANHAFIPAGFCCPHDPF